MENENNEKNSPAPEDKGQLEDIFKSGSVIAKNARESIHCLSIIGQIEGHYLLGDNQKATKYEHIIPLLAAIEESDEIDGLLVVLNTMGGDVEAGLAIAEMIASMTKPTASLVLGGGHSIGVPLAVSAKVSFIVPTATMTIHPVRMTRPRGRRPPKPSATSSICRNAFCALSLTIPRPTPITCAK